MMNANSPENARPPDPKTHASRTHGVALTAAIACVAGILGAPAAQAYIDPGAGSLAVQVLIGGTAVALGAVSAGWTRLKHLLRGMINPRRSRTDAKSEPQPDERPNS